MDFNKIGTDRELEGAALVQQALILVEEIAQGKPQSYADYPQNPYRGRLDTRALTLKDAKRLSLQAAKLLRQAWDVLDPPMQQFK